MRTIPHLRRREVPEWITPEKEVLTLHPIEASTST